MLSRVWLKDGDTMSDTISISCPHCLTTNRVPVTKAEDKPICGRCHKALFNGEVVQLNDHWLNTFLDKNDSPILIDFWAPWCGPCMQMEPEFAAAAQLLEPTLRLGRINTEQNGLIGSRYNIRSIPTLILFDHYHEIARCSGLMNTSAIVAWVHENMAMSE